MPQGVADLIDLSDIVIRFNDCRSMGAGGSRTDVVAVCNTGRPGREMSEGPRGATMRGCSRLPLSGRCAIPRNFRRWSRISALAGPN